MRWYRVELDADGKVVRVEQCPQAEDADRVFYVRATGKRDAEKRARARQRCQRTKRYKAMGLCSCGKPRTMGELCDNCKARKRRNSARWRGEEVPAAVAPARHDEPLRVVLRREILLEVLRWWQDAPNNRAFTIRLKEEIDKLTKREAA